MIKKTYDRFNETVYIIKLKNGMQVHILPKDDPYFTTYVELSLPYGALDLTYKKGGGQIVTPQGSAHFLEHKIFAMPDGDAFAKFSMLGVDANAMTSYNQTSYLFLATENVMESLSYLMDMMDTPYFTLENVNSEKNIIAEELKMYLDDPNVVMQNKLMEMMYHTHPIRYDIGGTLDSIIEVTPETIRGIYDTFYNPSNRLIVIAGKVDLKQIQAFFKTYDQKSPTKNQKPKTIYPKEPKKLVERNVIEKMNVGIDKLMIGVKLSTKKLTSSEQIKKEMAMSMLMNILLGTSSEFYSKLLQDKLINQSFYVNVTYEKNAENIMIYAESKHIKKLKRVLIELLTETGKDVLTESAFLRYKKVYLGQFIYALNSLETKAYLYGKYHLMGSSLFEVVDLLQDVTYQDVMYSMNAIQKKYIATLIYKKA